MPTHRVQHLVQLANANSGADSKGLAKGDQDCGNGQVSQWPGQGHLQLLVRLFGYLLHLGQPTDGEEGDVPHRHPVAHGSQAVRQFVQGDAGEEQQGDHHAEHGPSRPCPQADPPAIGRPDQDQHEGQVNLDVNAPHSKQFDRPTHFPFLL